MKDVRAHWRARYAPGEWIVLTGPTALVVLQPFSEEWSALVTTLWEEVLASASIIDLTERMTAQGLDEMPSFGAFFWSADGMRSLVRGAVTVVDVATDRVVADGPGVQDWSAGGLRGVEQVRMDLPTAEAGGRMTLPTVVGAVRASMVTLEAQPGRHLSSPQVWAASPAVAAASDSGSAEAPGHADLVPGGTGEGRDDAELTGADTEPMVPDAELAGAGTELMENGDTELMDLPPELASASPARAGTRPDVEPPAPRLPGITLSDGRVVQLGRPVRIGRAPIPDRGGEVLLVVSSPNADISRTHLQIRLQDGQVVATDLHSTNGTLLERPQSGGRSEQLAPGTAVPVPIGSRLDLGDGVTVRIDPPTGPT